MGNGWGVNGPLDFQIAPRVAKLIEQPDATTEKYRHEVICISLRSPASMHCWTRLAPPATETSLSPAASRAWARADSRPSVTKMNDVPPCFATSPGRGG